MILSREEPSRENVTRYFDSFVLWSLILDDKKIYTFNINLIKCGIYLIPVQRKWYNLVWLMESTSFLPPVVGPRKLLRFIFS